MRFPIIPIVPAEALIPVGPYCYTPLESPSAENGWRYRVKPCPFWSLTEDAIAQHGEQLGGYCGYLQKGDWMPDGPGLLWDQVKGCGVKDDDLA